MTDEAERLYREIGMMMVARALSVSGCSAVACKIAVRGQPGRDDVLDRQLTLYHNSNDTRRTFEIPWDGSGQWFWEIVDWLKSFHPTAEPVQSTWPNY